MAASNTDASRAEQNRGGERRFSRYDLLLLAIPTVFVLGLAVGQLSRVPLSSAMGAASLVAAVAVADGLFVNPPRR